jgi:hypothetical protein
MIWWTITSWVHQKSKLPKKIIHTFLKGEHLERVSTSQLAPRFPLGGWKCLVHLDTPPPTMIGWSISGWGAPKIKSYEGHPFESYSSLRRLNLGAPMGSRLRPWVWATFCYT